jgi:hypothetical protein
MKSILKNVWSGKPLEGDEKNYRVTFIQKVRKVTEITASSEEEAIIRHHNRDTTDRSRSCRRITCCR